MWLFWLIVAAVLVIWLLKKNKASEQVSSVPSPNLKITVSSRNGSSDQQTKVGYQATSDGGFQIGANLPFPLTLYGLDRDDAAKLASAMEQGQEYEIGEWFSHLVAEKNVSCRDLDEWLADAKPRITKLVAQRVQASTEWATATGLDKEDMLAEFQDDAVNDLPVRPGFVDSASTLLFEEPHDLTVDDALLARFKDNPKTYESLLYAISAGPKVQVAQAGDYRRKTFDELVEKGFMRRARRSPWKTYWRG